MGFDDFAFSLLGYEIVTFLGTGFGMSAGFGSGCRKPYPNHWQPWFMSYITKGYKLNLYFYHK